MQEYDTHQIIIEVPPAEVRFVDKLFKAYGGLAMVTINRDEKGKMILDVTDGTHQDVKEILQDLGRKFSVKIIKE